MQVLPSLILSEKTIAIFPGWSKPEPETGYCWFDVPLDIGGVTEPGFVLHGGCFISKPDQHVTLEVRIGRGHAKHCIPLARVDWRSLQDGHTNPRRRGAPHSGKRLPNTHFHAFELNYSAEVGHMKSGNLKMAEPISEDLQTFEQVRDFAGKRFRINNIDIVSKPEWEYTFGF